MSTDKKAVSEPIKCGHCGNTAPMEVGSTLSQVQSQEDGATGCPWDSELFHELLICPACRGVTLRRYLWDDSMEPDDASPEVIYPRGVEMPVGLPKVIERELSAANRVRSVSPNAYSVLLGRLLELVCDDRGAKKGGLAARLKDLSSRGEIPDKLVDMAEKLQQLRHAGAHAWVGDLTSAEVPLLDSLCRAILEYVYSAPHLVGQASAHLTALRSARRRARGRGKRDGV